MTLPSVVRLRLRLRLRLMEVEAEVLPDDVAQRGEAEVDGRPLLEAVGLQARGPLPLAAGQVHQVDVGLLGDALLGEDLTRTTRNQTTSDHLRQIGRASCRERV